MNDAPRLLDPVSAAAYIGFEPKTLESWRYSPTPEAPPWIRIGRSIRYDRRDLDAWIEARKTAAA